MTCKDCVHQTVCKVYGGLFPTRKDVDKICDHFMNISLLKNTEGFNEFWKQMFEAKNGK